MGLGSFLSSAGIGARVFREQDERDRLIRNDEADREMRRKVFELQQEQLIRQNEEARYQQEGVTGRRNAVMSAGLGQPERTISVTENQNELGPAGGINGRVGLTREVTYQPTPSRLDPLNAAAKFDLGRGDLDNYTKTQEQIKTIEKEGGLKVLEAYQRGAGAQELEKIYNDYGSKKIVPGTTRLNKNFLNAIDANTGQPMGELDLDKLSQTPEVRDKLGLLSQKDTVDIDLKKSQIEEHQAKGRQADAYAGYLGSRNETILTAAEARAAGGGRLPATGQRAPAAVGGEADVGKDLQYLDKAGDGIMGYPGMSQPDPNDSAKRVPTEQGLKAKAIAEQLARTNRVVPSEAGRIAATGRPDYKTSIDEKGKPYRQRVIIAKNAYGEDEAFPLDDKKEYVKPPKNPTAGAMERLLANKDDPAAVAEFESLWPGWSKRLLEGYDPSQNRELTRGNAQKQPTAPKAATPTRPGTPKAPVVPKVPAVISTPNPRAGNSAFGLEPKENEAINPEYARLMVEAERYAPPEYVNRKNHLGFVTAMPNPEHQMWRGMSLDEKMAYVEQQRRVAAEIR